ncbi:MAG: hypothetical protein ABIJ21_02920 [Nanoarchaeota archaeon]
MKDKEILKNIVDEKKKVTERPAIDTLTPAEKKEIPTFTTKYMEFLDAARTTHETTNTVLSWAKKNGFSEYRKGQKKFYIMNEDQSSIALVIAGKHPIEKGLSILGAHADFCCLHLKDHPLKEDSYLGIRLDTRPYGGFGNPHFTDTDYRIIGRVLKNGKIHQFEFDGTIFEPTVHITRDLEENKVKDAFKGENLDITVGCRTKKEFLKKISKLAGTTIEEKDFSRGDFYAVPKFKTIKLLDDELISGYGHDDRSSVFAIFEALFRSKPTHTTIAMSFDREEIGSTGLTGAIGAFFEQIIDACMENEEKSGDAFLRTILRNSYMVSADVDIALNFRNLELSDADNAAKSGRGLVICRANGGRGQGGGNRAPSFLMDYLMTLFEKKKVIYQVSSIPTKIEQGGGGTIGRYFAERGVPTADVGCPVSGMHGKRSILHIGDLYQAIKGFQAFIEREK